MRKFGAFPRDLINETLVFLPVKSLLRFKGVCKSFYSTIESQYFVNSHSKRCGDNNSHKLIQLQKFGDNIHAFKFSDDFERQLVLVQPISTRVLDFGYSHCNGLVLLHILEDEFSVWNPSSQEYRVLPSLSLKCCFGFGLGYDSTRDDYKAVVIAPEKPWQWHRSQVWIFGLRSSRWRMIGDYPFHFSTTTIGGNRDCFVDGALHFIRFADDSMYSIVSFDVAKETFSEVKRPDCRPFIDPYPTLHVIGGCLAVNLFLAREQGRDICQIDTYLRKELTWTKLYSITKEPFGKEVFWFFSNARLAYSKDGDKVFFYVKGKLFSYDHKRRDLQEIEIETGDSLAMFFYTESLVKCK